MKGEIRHYHSKYKSIHETFAKFAHVFYNFLFQRYTSATQWHIVDLWIVTLSISEYQKVDSHQQSMINNCSINVSQLVVNKNRIENNYASDYISLFVWSLLQIFYLLLTPDVLQINKEVGRIVGVTWCRNNYYRTKFFFLRLSLFVSFLLQDKLCIRLLSSTLNDWQYFLVKYF